MHYDIEKEYCFVRIHYDSKTQTPSRIFLPGVDELKHIEVQIMECVHKEEVFGGRVGYQFLDAQSRIWVALEYLDLDERPLVDFQEIRLVGAEDKDDKYAMICADRLIWALLWSSVFALSYGMDLSCIDRLVTVREITRAIFSKTNAYHSLSAVDKIYDGLADAQDIRDHVNAMHWELNKRLANLSSTSDLASLVAKQPEFEIIKG
jgi:hypothetical protein